MNKPNDLYIAALEVLPNAYCPYSNFPVAAAIRCIDGSIYSGVNVENIAFPLGCCAEQSAISSMIGSSQKEIAEILILVPGPHICPPCGGCRQLINEFAKADCPVHLCTVKGENYSQTTIGTLLPGAFSELTSN